MRDSRTTEIYCHDCDGYIRVALDYSLNGNHEIVCPECSHIHYRIINNGEVTGDRYRSSAGAIITASTSMANYYITGSTSTTTASNYFMAQLWLDSTTTS